MISNPNNSQVRAVRKLRKRRERERRRVLLVEGHRALDVAVRAGCPILELIHTETGAAKRGELVRTVKASGAKVLAVTDAVMASLTSVGSTPDVVGVVPMREATLEEAAEAFGLGTVLAGVHDPATAGAVMASCAAAGGSVAIATTGTTDIFAPKPVRSAAGAHFLMRVVAGVDPSACAGALKAAGVSLVALDDGSGAAHASPDLSEPLAVIVSDVGELPQGLAHEVSARMSVHDRTAPIRPPLAAEAAVVLFEAVRRRSSHAGSE